MVKADIVERINESMGFTKVESLDLIETVFSVIKDTLEVGENIKITGFGNFEVKRKNERPGRNPQTGETITIEARHILTFKPSNILKSAVNGKLNSGDNNDNG
jgi:integration host factor subunit alpha